jgi:asparagine synthase (glutamine-hydrolysing)
VKKGFESVMEKLLSEVRQNIQASLRKNLAEGILMSGGIDSGILAYLAPHAKGITVSLDGQGDDLRSVSILRRVLDRDPILVNVTIDEALAALRTVVRILESFDPALPNDLAVYCGMREAKQQGFSSLMTGDGGDELFGGYPFMQEMEDLDGYIRGMSRLWSFSSNSIGEHFGLKVKQPYLDDAFVDFALTVPGDLKIREDNGQVWGKWILRKAFEPFLPPEFIWQGKRPLEVGSGMTLLRAIIAERIDDKEFGEKQRQYPVKFLCKEHLHFYEIYREVVGEIPLPQQGEEQCPGCGTGIPKGKRHCRVCGWVP